MACLGHTGDETGGCVLRQGVGAAFIPALRHDTAALSVLMAMTASASIGDYDAPFSIDAVGDWR